MKYCLFLMLELSSMTYSSCFLYPVGFLHHRGSILFLKQESKNHTRLYMWHQHTKHLENILWSLFNPGYIQVLPDESGFSFLDNGRFRIQYFHRRSPKTIDFDHYFYNMHGIHWINPQEFYFSAQAQHDHYALFHSCVDGTTSCLISHNTYDCMYPQKVDNELFFIKRIGDRHSIVHALFSFQHKNKTLDELICFGHPIIFLSMQSPSEGFVIGHQNSWNDNTSAITFYYYQIKKKKKIWKKSILFSFSIPAELVVGNSENRLYESLLPVIPCVKGTKIYYVDSSESQHNTLELYVYNKKTATIKKLCVPIRKRGHYYHLLVPLVMGNKCIIGGQLFC